MYTYRNLQIFSRKIIFMIYKLTVLLEYLDLLQYFHERNFCMILANEIKTHDSEMQGQEEAATTE